MPKCRKKPIVVDFVEWDGDPTTANTFIGERFGVDWWYASREDSSIVIPTLEGNHVGNLGDMIIKGVKGEFYPIKRDIFKETYDVVDG
jgi:hypothetical protein